MKKTSQQKDMIGPKLSIGKSSTQSTLSFGGGSTSKNAGAALLITSKKAPIEADQKVVEVIDCNEDEEITLTRNTKKRVKIDEDDEVAVIEEKV